MQGYNCSQSVAMAFADLMGMEEATAARISSGFGGGMGHTKNTCGAITGALMVLGMLGYSDQQANALLRQVREGHGALDCASLLRTAHEQGIAKKPHCDGMVFELVEALDAILSQKT